MRETSANEPLKTHRKGIKGIKTGELLCPGRSMEDTYLPAFRAAVTEGKAESVMCAYNRVNGEPACANTFLLVDTLRGAWKFNGYVVSDCDAVYDIFHGHQFAKSQAEAPGPGPQRDDEASHGRAYLSSEGG